MKLKFKKKKQTPFKPGYSLGNIRIKHIGGHHSHLPIQPRTIKPRSTCLFAPVQSSKPVKRYWGDYDKDGVINGLDCEPRNRFKQGAGHDRRKAKNKKHQLEHKKKGASAALRRYLKEEKDKEESGSGVFSIGDRGEMVELSEERFAEDMREAGFADDEAGEGPEAAMINYKKAVKRRGRAYADKIYKPSKKEGDRVLADDRL